MEMENGDLCAVHFIGNFPDGGGVMMLDQESVRKIRCFVCGRRVTLTEIVVMSLSPDDMVCVCKRHPNFNVINSTYYFFISINIIREKFVHGVTFF